jgi:hypothetical protein
MPLEPFGPVTPASDVPKCSLPRSPQSTAAPQLPFVLQLLHGRRVAPTFIDIDDARSGMGM